MCSAGVTSLHFSQPVSSTCCDLNMCPLPSGTHVSDAMLRLDVVMHACIPTGTSQQGISALTRNIMVLPANWYNLWTCPRSAGNWLAQQVWSKKFTNFLKAHLIEVQVISVALVWHGTRCGFIHQINTQQTFSFLINSPLLHCWSYNEVYW